MERVVNGLRLHQVGERFTIVDLNPTRIPRIDRDEPIVVQLQPKAMRSVITRVEPDVDIARVEDQAQWVFWEKIYLRTESASHRKGSLFQMSTKRRVFNGVYTNRSGVYLFVHESADQESFKKLLETVFTSIPSLTSQDLTSIIRSQLLASQLKAG